MATKQELQGKIDKLKKSIEGESLPPNMVETVKKALAKAESELSDMEKAETKVEEAEKKVEVAEAKVEEAQEKKDEAETPAGEKKAEAQVEGAEKKVEEAEKAVEVAEAKVEASAEKAETAIEKAEAIIKKHGGFRPRSGRKPIEGRVPVVRGAHGGLRPNAGRKRKSRLPSRSIDLNKVKETDADFCNRVLAEWRKRRTKAKASAKKHRRKTISSIIVERVASAVEKGIESVSQAEIKKNPAQFKTKAVRLEKSAKAFLRDFKSLLGDAIKQKDIDSEFKDVESVINKLVSRFKK